MALFFHQLMLLVFLVSIPINSTYITINDSKYGI